MIRRFLAYNSGVLDIARIHRLLGEVVAGAAGHGPVHLLLSSAGGIGSPWDQYSVFGLGLDFLISASLLPFSVF